MSHFIVILAFMQWPGTEPAIFVRLPIFTGLCPFIHLQRAIIPISLFCFHIFFSLPLISLLLFDKDPCDYIGPTWVIQEHLPMGMSLV